MRESFSDEREQFHAVHFLKILGRAPRSIGRIGLVVPEDDSKAPVAKLCWRLIPIVSTLSDDLQLAIHNLHQQTRSLVSQELTDLPPRIEALSWF